MAGIKAQLLEMEVRIREGNEAIDELNEKLGRRLELLYRQVDDIQPSTSALLAKSAEEIDDVSDACKSLEKRLAVISTAWLISIVSVDGVSRTIINFPRPGSDQGEGRSAGGEGGPGTNRKRAYRKQHSCIAARKGRVGSSAAGGEQEVVCSPGAGMRSVSTQSSQQCLAEA